MDRVELSQLVSQSSLTSELTSDTVQPEPDQIDRLDRLNRQIDRLGIELIDRELIDRQPEAPRRPSQFSNSQGKDPTNAFKTTFLPLSLPPVGFFELPVRQRNERQPFELVGVLRAWVQKPGQPIKAFWLSTAHGNYLIKFKRASTRLDGLTTLPAMGESIRVIGTYRYKHSKHSKKNAAKHQDSLTETKTAGSQPRNLVQNSPQLKLKAKCIQPLNWGLTQATAPAVLPAIAPAIALAPPTQCIKPVEAPADQIPKSAKILVCQKSTCRAKGSTTIQKAVEHHLQKHGLTGVKVQSSGCLGCCKKAPCLMLMPSKDKHHKLKPADVPAILAEGLPKAAEDLPKASDQGV
jgi:(2Fe-2S) ferredoxin